MFGVTIKNKQMKLLKFFKSHKKLTQAVSKHWFFWYSRYQRKLLKQTLPSKSGRSTPFFSQFLFLSYWYSFYHLNSTLFSYYWNFTYAWFELVRYKWIFKVSNLMVKFWRFLFLQRPSSQAIKQSYLLNRLDDQLQFSVPSFHFFQRGWNSQPRTFRGFFLFSYINWRWRTVYYPYLLCHYPRTVYFWTFRLRYQDYFNLPTFYLYRYSNLVSFFRYYSRFELNFKLFQRRSITHQTVFWEKKFLTYRFRLDSLRKTIRSSFNRFLSRYPHRIINFSPRKHRTHPENQHRRYLTHRLTKKVNRWLRNSTFSRFRGWTIQPVYRISLTDQPYTSLQDSIAVELDPVFPTSDPEPFDELYDELFEDQQDDTESFDTDFNDETDLYGTGSLEETGIDDHRYRRYPRFSKKWSKYGIPYDWRPYHQIKLSPPFLPKYDRRNPSEPPTFYRADYFLEEEFFTFNELARNNTFYEPTRLMTGDGPNVLESDNLNDDVPRKAPLNFSQNLLDWHFMFRENNQLTNREILPNLYSLQFWWYIYQFPRAFDDFPRSIFQFHRRFRRFWSIRFRKIGFDDRDFLYKQRNIWFRALHLGQEPIYIKRLGGRFRRLARLSKIQRRQFYHRHQAHLVQEGYSDQEVFSPRTRPLGYDYYRKHFKRKRPPKPLSKWVRQLKSMGRDRSTKRRLFPRRHFPKYSPVYASNRLLFEQLTGNNTFGFRRFMLTRDDFTPAVGLFSVFFIGFFVWFFQLCIYFVDDQFFWKTLFFDQSINSYLGSDLARRPQPSDLYTFFDPGTRVPFWREYPVRPKLKDYRWNVYGAHVGRMKLWSSWWSLGWQVDQSKFVREVSWYYGVGKAYRHIYELNPNWIFQVPKLKRLSIDFEPPWLGDWSNWRMPFRTIIDTDYFTQRRSTIHHRREIARVHGKKDYRNSMWTGANMGQIYVNHVLPHASYISSRLIFGDIPVRVSTRWLSEYGKLERNYFWPLAGAIRNKAVRNLNYLYTDTLIPVKLQTRNVHTHLLQLTPLWENYLNSLFVGTLRQSTESSIDQRSYYDPFIVSLFFLFFKNCFFFFYSFNWSLFYFWWFILFFPVICLSSYRYFYLAHLQSDLLTLTLPEHPVKRGKSSSTQVLPAVTAFDFSFYQHLWLRLENLYSRPNRRLDRRYDFYDIVEFKGRSSHRSRKTSLSRSIPTVKHRLKPQKRYFFHNSNHLRQDVLTDSTSISQPVSLNIRSSRILYDQMLSSVSFRKKPFSFNRFDTFDRLLISDNSTAWLARPVLIDCSLPPSYSLLRQPESNETIIRTGGRRRHGRYRRKNWFDVKDRQHKTTFVRKTYNFVDNNHHFRTNSEIKPFQLKRLQNYQFGVPPTWVLKRVQHTYLSDRHQQTICNFRSWVSPTPLTSSIYVEFIEAVFVSELDAGYDTELFDEELSETLFGNHGEEEDADDGFDRADNIYEDYSLISSLTSNFISRVVQPVSFNSRQLNLLSYQRFNSLPAHCYQFSPPTETKQLDTHFLSETYYSPHAVDHSGFSQLFLTTYSLPLLYQHLLVSKNETKKLSTTRSSEKDQLKIDYNLYLHKKGIPLTKQLSFGGHPYRQAKLNRTRTIELSGCPVNYDWPVRNTWLTNHLYEVQNYDLWSDLPSQIHDYTYEIGLTIVDYSEVDVAWALDDEDSIDLETSVSYNLGYRWSGFQLYLESFLRPVELTNSVLNSVWCYESGYSLDRELCPEDLNYPPLLDLENYLLEYLTKDYTTSFDYENVFYDINEYFESIELFDKPISDDDDSSEMDEDSEMNLIGIDNMPEKLLRTALSNIVLGSSSMDHLLDRFNGLHSTSGFPFIYSRHYQSLYELHFSRPIKRSRYDQPGFNSWRNFWHFPTEYYMHENLAHPLDPVNHHLMESLYCDFFITQWAIDEIYYKDSPHGICVHY